jgi:hypothetical protein
VLAFTSAPTDPLFDCSDELLVAQQRATVSISELRTGRQLDAGARIIPRPRLKIIRWNADSRRCESFVEKLHTSLRSA